MNDRLLYIETVADESLDLAEDIVRLGLIRDLLSKLITVEKDGAYALINKVDDYERQTRFMLRHKYLQGPIRPVYESLRERLKSEIQAEENRL